MSALVSYESSSEEDEPPQPEPPATTVLKNVGPGSRPSFNQDNDVLEAAGIPKSGPEVSRAEDGPMVGPAMPDTLEAEDEDDSLSELQQSMSERDAIRYLTQATHPMTSIPASPPSSPDPALDAKFQKFLELKSQGVHFNEGLASKSTFRNPSLLATMMARAGLDGPEQYGTSLPLDVYDPSGFPPFAYKEELLRSQQTLRDQDLAAKKALSAQGKRTIEFASGGSSGNASRESTPGMPTKRRRP
jgi:hypothetical protein